MNVAALAGGLCQLVPGCAMTPHCSGAFQVMQTQFAQDNNPDAQTLQKLAERTGLSRRVIQVGVETHNECCLCHPAIMMGGGRWLRRLSVWLVLTWAGVSLHFKFFI